MVHSRHRDVCGDMLRPCKRIRLRTRRAGLSLPRHRPALLINVADLGVEQQQRMWRLVAQVYDMAFDQRHSSRDTVCLAAHGEPPLPQVHSHLTKAALSAAE